jgi:metal-responsive CopG/Arc/MetJ family transcriptional regulator
VNKYPTITFRIDQDLLERLDTAVKERNYRSRSAYIIDALSSQIKEDEHFPVGYGWKSDDTQGL